MAPVYGEAVRRGASSSPQPGIFLPPHAWKRARRPRRPRRAATRRESACVRPAGPRAASCSSPASARGASTGCATRTAATASGPAEARLGPLGGYNPAMARARKSDKSGTGKSKAFSIFDGDENHTEDGQEDLPKDEAGRRKIKRQYEELLGIRIEKLGGRAGGPPVPLHRGRRRAPGGRARPGARAPDASRRSESSPRRGSARGPPRR